MPSSGVRVENCQKFQGSPPFAVSFRFLFTSLIPLTLILRSSDCALDLRSTARHSLMRRTSVSLPTRNVAHDPYEKSARYGSTGASNSAAGTLERIKTAWMTQSQRSRYLKTGGILLFVVFLFYYLSPSGTDVYGGGKEVFLSIEAPLLINRP